MAAGVVGDGRGLAAVLALGADAAWLGTRFVASEEAPFAPEYKQRVVAAPETEAIYTTLFDVGWPEAPHRVLPNSTVADWEAAGRPEPSARPGEGEIVARTPDGEAVPRYAISEPTVDMTGRLEALALYAGQSAGLVGAIEPAGEDRPATGRGSRDDSSRPGRPLCDGQSLVFLIRLRSWPTRSS